MQDGKRPGSVTVRLLKDGVEFDSRTVTAADGWAWSFGQLPKFESGRLISYTLAEDSVPGYVSEVDGFDVTNSYTPSKVDIRVVKAWEDDGDRDGQRPDSVSVKLLADGRDTGKSLVLNAAGKWSGSFVGLDEYRAGVKIKYTIEEVGVERGYSSVVTGDAQTGFTVTNTLIPPQLTKSGATLTEMFALVSLCFVVGIGFFMLRRRNMDLFSE